MRYIISDIHGEYSLFMELMEKIGFSEKDELYVCGDFIEKGDSSVKLAKYLMNHSNIYCIRGNHEESFLNLYHALMRETDDYDEVLRKLQDCLHGDGNLLDFELLDALDNLPYYIETADFICVHAGVPIDDNGKIPPLETVLVEELIYNRKFKNPEILPTNCKCVFYGHTSSQSLFDEAKIVEYYRTEKPPKSIIDYIKVHLDTGVFTSGVLGCFCIDSCSSIYVNKH